MILYGRFISPYVRRVAIWMQLQGRAYEHRVLSPFDHADQVRPVSPVLRVPALVLPDGAPLLEAFAICDWLDMTAAPGRALVPAENPARLMVMRTLALASAATDKAVTLVYERNRRDPAFRIPAVIERTEEQVRAGLDAVEDALPARGWLGGAQPNGADVTAVCLRDFVQVMHPGLLAPARPRLQALSAMAAELPAFAETHP